MTSFYTKQKIKGKTAHKNIHTTSSHNTIYYTKKIKKKNLNNANTRESIKFTKYFR